MHTAAVRGLNLRLCGRWSDDECHFDARRDPQRASERVSVSE